ncbi:MAG: ATP-binding protein [Oligoflexia bacterium]|nr:ATP-binding protein [Oligoflexia bacterium]
MEFDRIIDLNSLIKKNSFFLFGPRGTGKSFWIKKSLSSKSTKIFDLLDDDIYERFLRRPKQLSEEISDNDKIIVIDEIQKLPKLLDEVHRLIEDKKRNLKFLLTGSSARKLKRNDVNMLGGRAWEAHFFPFISREIKNFDLLKYFNLGGLPKVYLSKYPEEDLKAYVRLYISQEIKEEALTRKIENFVRFLDVIAMSNGEEIVYQNLANDSGVPPRTIENYINILVDTLMGFELYPFLLTKKRKAITRSKFYFFDIGVVNKLTNRGPISEGNPVFGECFEHFIILEIRAYLSITRKDYNLFYWRTKNGAEVDLIIGKVLAIEIKSTKSVHDRHIDNLKLLKEEGLIKNFIIVSQDPVRKKMDNNITSLFWKDFIADLWSGKLC